MSSVKYIGGNYHIHSRAAAVDGCPAPAASCRGPPRCQGRALATAYFGAALARSPSLKAHVRAHLCLLFCADDAVTTTKAVISATAADLDQT